MSKISCIGGKKDELVNELSLIISLKNINNFTQLLLGNLQFSCSIEQNVSVLYNAKIYSLQHLAILFSHNVHL